MRRPPVDPYHQHRHVIFGQILRMPLPDLFQQSLNQLARLHVPQVPHDPQHARLAQILAIGIAGFNQCIRVADHAIAGFQLHVELLVL